VHGEHFKDFKPQTHTDWCRQERAVAEAKQVFNLTILFGMRRRL
jgi:hypothetical protein